MFKLNFQKMKYLLLGTALGVSLSFSTLSFANNPIKIILNGKTLQNAEVININNSTYLPVRKLCEALNLKVIWDARNNTVIIDNVSKNSDAINNSNDNTTINSQTIPHSQPIQNNNNDSNSNSNKSNMEILRNYNGIDTAIKINGTVYLPFQDGAKYYNVTINEVDLKNNTITLNGIVSNISNNTNNNVNVIIYNSKIMIKETFLENIKI